VVGFCESFFAVLALLGPSPNVVYQSVQKVHTRKRSKVTIFSIFCGNKTYEKHPTFLASGTAVEIIGKSTDFLKEFFNNHNKTSLGLKLQAAAFQPTQSFIEAALP